jgi:hypothetical protein
MKRLLSVLLIGVLAAPAGAQQPIDSNMAAGRGFRFYIAPAAQATQISTEAAAVTGLEFGWMVTPRLTLGMATYRLANNIEAAQPCASGAKNIEFFYSGLTAAYGVEVAPRTRLIGHTLIGAGEAHWREGFWGPVPDPDHKDRNHTTSFVAEPGMGVEVELLPWMRANLSGGYRIVTGGESSVLEQKDMRSFTGTFGLRFGRF